MYIISSEPLKTWTVNYFRRLVYPVFLINYDFDLEIALFMCCTKVFGFAVQGNLCGLKSDEPLTKTSTNICRDAITLLSINSAGKYLNGSPDQN